MLPEGYKGCVSFVINNQSLVNIARWEGAHGQRTGSASYPNPGSIQNPASSDGRYLAGILAAVSQRMIHNFKNDCAKQESDIPIMVKVGILDYFKERIEGEYTFGHSRDGDFKQLAESARFAEIL